MGHSASTCHDRCPPPHAGKNTTHTRNRHKKIPIARSVDCYVVVYTATCKTQHARSHLPLLSASCCALMRPSRSRLDVMPAPPPTGRALAVPKRAPGSPAEPAGAWSWHIQQKKEKMPRRHINVHSTRQSKRMMRPLCAHIHHGTPCRVTHVCCNTTRT